MNIPNLPNISSLMKQKIAEIQGRLPIKMNVSSSSNTDFAQELDKASAALESAAALAESSTLLGEFAAPIIDMESSTQTVAKTKYPLVSGSDRKSVV